MVTLNEAFRKLADMMPDLDEIKKYISEENYEYIFI
ncbi:hypothetical protein DFR56_101416 [Pseudogracilibacillus auburnensis]|uniref:Uncharacterized protein n=1 Tax=Pseudogracilibacillus auburnensis TaxID=1494959 RepID=A0A2V3WBI2_9BACI|nr:hypothetical protein DFR56_101416 [Pseudogracilibacillus auburnensis]